MKTLIRLAIASSLAVAFAAGCDDDATEEAAAPAEPAAETAAAETAAAEPAEAPAAEAAEAADPDIVTVDQLAAWLDAHEAVPVDANNDQVREEFGVIPGARVLTSSSEYDPAAELPAEKDARLVFYCANEQCSASDGAAGRAIAAGYTDVNVLRAGIRGWKESGQPTQPRS